jgi:4-amino-4-deoxy-L-arabinose transferase-like glycosyltransferase
MTKFLQALIFLILILQLITAAGFELAHDEAYYWLFSRHLDWGFFDHPPFMAVIIRLFSFLPHSEFSVRIGFILLQFLTLLLLLKLVSPKLRPRATLLFFAFPLASLTGLLALPDIPLLFMTGVYCFLLKRYLDQKDLSSSILLGVGISLLLYAKYHGILLIFFTLIALPSLFRQRNFYLVAFIAILCFLPHIMWQYQHDFMTLRYHFLDRPSSAFSIKRILDYTGVQIALAGGFVGPLVWWLTIRARPMGEFERAMKFVSLGTFLFFLISTFSKKFEANWTIFLAVPLILTSVDSSLWEKRIFRILLNSSFLIVIVARLLFLFPPETLGIKRLKEFNGWHDWASLVKEKCSGTLVANSYQIASKLSFYLNREVHSLNYHSRKNQFDIWRWDLVNPIKEVCYLTDKKEFSGTPLVTPDGKELTLVTKFPYEELLQRKRESVR